MIKYPRFSLFSLLPVVVLFCTLGACTLPWEESASFAIQLRFPDRKALQLGNDYTPVSSWHLVGRGPRGATVDVSFGAEVRESSLVLSTSGSWEFWVDAVGEFFPLEGSHVLFSAASGVVDLAPDTETPLTFTMEGPGLLTMSGSLDITGFEGITFETMYLMKGPGIVEEDLITYPSRDPEQTGLVWTGADLGNFQGTYNIELSRLPQEIDTWAVIFGNDSNGNVAFQSREPFRFGTWNLPGINLSLSDLDRFRRVQVSPDDGINLGNTQQGDYYRVGSEFVLPTIHQLVKAGYRLIGFGIGNTPATLSVLPGGKVQVSDSTISNLFSAIWQVDGSEAITLGSTASASLSSQGSEFGIDGDLNTHWASPVADAQGILPGGPVTYRIPLDGSYSIKQVAIQFGTDVPAFSIYFFDGTNDILMQSDVSGVNQGIFVPYLSNEPVVGTSILLEFTTALPNQSIQINEIKVFGDYNIE